MLSAWKEGSTLFFIAGEEIKYILCSALNKRELTLNWKVHASEYAKNCQISLITMSIIPEQLFNCINYNNIAELDKSPKAWEM